MGTTAVAEAPANAANGSGSNHAELVAAIESIGGVDVLLRRTSLSREYLDELLNDGVAVEPDLCPEIERATRTPCEKLRADLVWHRDGAGEVIGYTSPVDGNTLSSVTEALRGPRAEKSRYIATFGELPVIDRSIFSINPDIPLLYLISEATCIVDGLVSMVGDGVETPISGGVAWLIERNLDCVRGLLHAAESREEARQWGLK